MADVGKPGENLADKPGATVFRPGKAETVDFDSTKKRAVDRITGDYLILDPGHASSWGRYSFGNVKSGLIAYGSYQAKARALADVSSFDVASLFTELGSGAPSLSRSEFDFTPIARMFRGYYDSTSPRPAPTVIVVDSRPEFSSNSN